jgi:hypothetical protein
MANLFDALDQADLETDLNTRAANAPDVPPNKPSEADVFSVMDGEIQPEKPRSNGGMAFGAFPGEGIGEALLQTGNRFVGGITEAGAGVVQAGLDAIDSVWGPPQGEQSRAGRFADTFNAERDAVLKATRASFADSFMFDAAEKAGEIIPAFFLPTNSIKQGMGVGLAEGLAQFQDNPDEQSRLAAGGVGAAAGGVAATIGSVIDFFSPGRFAASGVSDVQGKVASSRELSQKTGVDFKLSQILEDSGAESLESLAKTSLKGERMARAFENKQMLQSYKFMKKLERSLDPGKVDFGTRISKAFEDTSQKMTSIRSTQAAKDFNEARAVAGDRGIIPSTETKRTLDELIDGFDSEKTRAIPAMRTFLKNLNDLQEKFADKPSMSVKELQNLMASFGKAADGKGGFFSDVPGFDKHATHSIHRALQADLKAAGDADVVGAVELRKARANYEANSQVIDELKSTTLAKLFNSKTMPPPEKIEQVFSTMPPSQITAAMKLLSDTDPGLHQGLQRFTLGNALTKGRQAAAAAPSGDVRFNPEAALKALSNDAQFKAVFNDARTRAQVMDGVRVLRKLGIGSDRPSAQLVQKTREGAGVVQSLNGTFVTRFLAGTLAPTAFAKVLFTKEGVNNLRLLAKPTTKPAAVASAMVELEQLMESGE